eukprot:4645539-Pyramimonas_sp.AAC.1
MVAIGSASSLHWGREGEECACSRARDPLHWSSVVGRRCHAPDGDMDHPAALQRQVGAAGPHDGDE